MIRLALTCGWSAGHALLLPITAYFFLTSGRARRASRGFLGRAFGRQPSVAEMFRHFLAFSTAILDRIFFLSNRLDRFTVEVEGLDALKQLVAAGRGCVLLGAHLGSFEALRVVARQAPVAVRPVMYRRHTGIVTRLFEALDPALGPTIIEIGAPNAMLKVAESVGRGEIVGLLADRTPHAQKTVTVPFLGAPAALPTGPFILAAAIHAPAMLFFAVRTGPRRYLIRFEPFAEEIVLARGRRQADLQRWVGLYAARLEAMARAHPFNWFNFFDFWEPSGHDTPCARAADPVPERTAGSPAPAGLVR